VQYDTPENIYNKPVNRFVASFIGSPAMNLIDATLISKDGEYSARINENKEILLPWQKFNTKTLMENTGNKITLGIRPSGFSLGEASLDCIHAKVDMVELIGEEKYIHFASYGLRLIAAVNAETPVKTGENYDFQVNPGKIFIFDKNGLRIEDIEKKSQ
jgi:multiple sugar transport system ATP-binding protein